MFKLREPRVSKSSRWRDDRHREAGFTMIEIMIASITIALTVAAVASAFNTVEVLNRRARNLTIATQLVQQQMEVYRNTPFAGLPVAGTTDVSSILSPYPSLGSPRSATATVTDVDPGDLKQIDITLSYTESGHTKTVEATTQIAVRGLNK